jgi:predicted MPP superfamily phosphohydrolase
VSASRGATAGSGDPFLSLGRRRGGLSRLVSVTGRADVVTYDLTSPRWQAPPLTMACLSDFHAMRPWSPLRALDAHVDAVNAMGVDIIFLLGDYISAGLTPGLRERPDRLVRALSRLEAPLGVHAILGNHDWIDDELASETDFVTSVISQALVSAKLNPLINTSRRVTHGGQDLWIVGMDSQTADRAGVRKTGRHDPDAAFREVPDESLAILLAHEPDYFVTGDHRPVLQLSGHTHGGQANLFGWRPFTPSDYNQRYAYGHVVEDGRQLVVSGGLGYTHVPMRIAVPPEITLVRIGAPEA